jgi:hypothetical protein
MRCMHTDALIVTRLLGRKRKVDAEAARSGERQFAESAQRSVYQSAVIFD